MRNEQRKDGKHASDIDETTLVPCQPPRRPYDSDKALQLEELTRLVRKPDRQLKNHKTPLWAAINRYMSKSPRLHLGEVREGSSEEVTLRLDL